MTAAATVKNAATYLPSQPSFDRYAYKKSPVRIAALYRAFQERLRREGGTNISFRACALPSHLFVAVSEYAVSLTFALALRAFREIAPDDTVSIRGTYTPTHAVISLSAETDLSAAVCKALKSCGELLFDIATPSHFTVHTEESDGTVCFSLLLPYYDEATFELHALDISMAEIVARAFRDAKNYSFAGSHKITL